MNKVANSLLRILPFNLTKLFLKYTSSRLYKIAYASLKNRDVTIIDGIGSGLRFNVGNASPDYALGANELPVQIAFKDFVKCGDVLYDVGANIGFFTVIASKIVEKSGHVYAFEPVEENVNTIIKNINLNKFSNITVIGKAISKFVGKGELHLTEHPGGHTLSSVGMPHNAVDTVTIDIDTIDNLIENKKIDPPDIVKIDVEGAEIDVLQGMKRTLGEFHPTIIYEIDDRDLNKLENKQKEIQEYLYGFGYKIQDLEESYKGIPCFVRHAVALYNAV